MIAATEYLVRVGSSSLFAGFNLSVILFLVAVLRDPDRSQIVAWSIPTQWTAAARMLRRAAGFRVWGPLAKGILAFGAACLMLAGVTAVIGWFVYGAGG